MKNPIRNFSYDPAEQVPGGLRIGVASADTPARDVVRHAALHRWDLVIITDGPGSIRLFFPQYVHEILPELPIASDYLLQGLPLEAMIDRLDRAGIDVHSELLNSYPQIRKCPQGHVTKDNPCQQHQLPTTPYP